MSDHAPNAFSKGAVLERLRAARKKREGEVTWLAWVLDALAVFILIAQGWTLIAIFVFVAARFAARVPTLIGWGFLAALAGFVVVPMLFLFFTTP
ncbi:hypothetical protein [Maricaulis sp.]|uniref:hypothetical protein n=1 Tax=Maricaulis sp. TaxID=1486257 RepID=UPI000C56DD14|nr:hypothetical protein [Maricaulis sp.]MAC89291.1 hypothetical protein [Maricaulis sp.]